MTEKQILKQLEKNLKPKRYCHTLHVIESAIKLADRYHVDCDQARLAAMLHDCAKNYSEKQLLDIAKESGTDVDYITLQEPQLLHGPIGAVVAQSEYGVDDERILNAIRFHTMGRVNMTQLEKIIYLADFIEVGRNYPGVELLRKVAFEDLDDAIILALSNTIRYIASIGGLIHPLTVDARNYLIMQRINMEG